MLPRKLHITMQIKLQFQQRKTEIQRKRKTAMGESFEKTRQLEQNRLLKLENCTNEINILDYGHLNFS